MTKREKRRKSDFFLYQRWKEGSDTQRFDNNLHFYNVYSTLIGLYGNEKVEWREGTQRHDCWVMMTKKKTAKVGIRNERCF